MYVFEFAPSYKAILFVKQFIGIIYFLHASAQFYYEIIVDGVNLSLDSRMEQAD